MNPVDAVRLGKWLQKYDPKFFGFVANSMPGSHPMDVQLAGLGEAVPAATTATPAVPTIWDKIQANASGFANTVTSLANSYYGYKTQKAVVSAAAKQAEASAPITAANNAPVLIPDGVKSTNAIAQQLWPVIAGAGLFAMAFMVASSGQKKR